MPDTITLLGSLAGLDMQAVVGQTVMVRVHYAPDGKLLGGTEPPGTVLGEPGYAPTGYGSARSLVTDEQGLFGGVLPWEDGGIYAVDVPGDVTRYLMMGTGAGEHPAGSTVNVRLLPGPDEVVTPSVSLDALVGEAVEDYLTAHPPAGGGGVTDHGALTGLDGDDHPHYLTAARGDARYVQPGALAPVATTGDYASLTGTLPTSALPPLAINSVTVVATQAAMLALTAERGDMAIRTDTGRTYVLASDSPATLADWKEVTAAGQVVSVSGQTGAVTLAKADVGLGSVDNTADTAKVFAGAQITSGTVAYARLPVGTAVNTVAAGDDSRFTNSRTPTAHASTHASGGSDPVSITAAQVTDSTATGRSVLTAADAAAARAVLGIAPIPTFVVATTATSNSTTTPTNCTGLSLSGLAAGLYEIDIYIRGQSAATTTGVQVALTWAGSGVTPTIRGLGTNTDASAPTWSTPDDADTSASLNPGNAPAANSPFLVASYSGMMRVAAGGMTGPVNVTVASEVAASQVQVLPDSFIRYRRIAN